MKTAVAWFGLVMAALTGAVSTASAATVSGDWIPQSASRSPTVRLGASMAYDSATHTAVLFGGRGSGSAPLNETWTWDGTTWTHKHPSTSPPGRDFASMAYDAARSRIVLFGGYTESTPNSLGDTWTWDGTTWSRQSPTASPPARGGATMADDAAAGSVVLFGGSSDTATLRDTWTWDGSSWTQRSPSSAPPARDGASMADGTAGSSVVLFGGHAASGFFADTWTWTAGAWVHQSPTASPPARSSASMSGENATGGAVLFGGTSGGDLGDTWTWNGTTWTQRYRASTPAPRYGAAMAYDAATASAVLFGGDLNTRDTWMWHGAATIVATATSVISSSNPSLIGQSVTYTATVVANPDGGTVSFADGGTAVAGCGSLPLSGGQASCTVTYNVLGSHNVSAAYGGDTSYRPSSGTLAQTVAPAPAAPTAGTWAQRAPPTSPPGISGASMAYDDATHTTIMFGGQSATGDLSDTWVWDGTTWSRQSPTTSPPARDGASMAYDAATRSIVLFGGKSPLNIHPFGDTWVWDGTNWSKKAPAHAPSGRCNASLADDASRSRLVLFGGIRCGADRPVIYRDTWTWDGTNWTAQSPATSPPARSGASMADDATRSLVVMFGGLSATNLLLDDTWTWNGAVWARVAPASIPQARESAVMAYDGAAHNLVLFGGLGGSASTGDTWTWDGTNWTDQSAATSPPGRNGASMAYDSARSMVVLFGGTAGPQFNDTWTRDGTTQTRASTTSPASSPNPSAPGGQVTYTATVAPTPTGTAPGTVSFTEAGAVIPGCGELPVVAGNAVCSAAPTTAGMHTITAAYSGNVMLTSSSAPLIQTVEGPTTTTSTMSSSSNPSMVGESVIYSVLVTPPPDGGSVSFSDSGAAIGACSDMPLTGGAASCPVTYAIPGSHSITAAYSGNAQFAASTGMLTQAVNASPVSTSASTPAVPPATTAPPAPAPQAASRATGPSAGNQYHATSAPPAATPAAAVPATPSPVANGGNRAGAHPPTRPPTVEASAPKQDDSTGWILPLIGALVLVVLVGWVVAPDLFRRTWVITTTRAQRLLRRPASPRSSPGVRPR